VEKLNYKLAIKVLKLMYDDFSDLNTTVGSIRDNAHREKLMLEIETMKSYVKKLYEHYKKVVDQLP